VSTVIQRSFSSGEVAPALYSRVDTTRYATGLKKLRNQYVMRHGGATNRPGTKFIGEVKDSTKAVRLIPFVFSDAQTYVLEFGDQYMRVIKQGDYVMLTSQAITAISNANPCVVTYSGSDTYANGDVIYVSGIVGAIGTYLNGRTFKVANVNTGANTFELDYMDGANVNSTSMGSYTSGGTLEEVYTITTPYVEADLPTIQFAQSADVMTLVHPSYAIRELTRTGDASWTLAVANLGDNLNCGLDTLTLTGYPGTAYHYTITGIDEFGQESVAIIGPAATFGTNTVPSSATPVTVGWNLKGGSTAPLSYNIYRSDTGLLGTYGYIGYTDGTSTSFVDRGVPPDFSTNPPIDTDPLNASGDYPSAVAYIQQRRWFASTTNDPEKVFASRVAAFGYFYKTSPIADDDRIIFELSGNRVAEVRHLVDLGSAVLFTNSSEYALQGDNGFVTPVAINPKQYSKNGASTLSPLIIDSTALYVQARGSAIRDLSFDFQVDGYRGNDLTIFASHLVDGYTIDDWAFQAIPHSVVWAVRGDGTLLSLTYVREQQILGWATHDFDGGLVENVCVVPEGTEDAVYLVIQRTINGRSCRYVERFAQRRVDDRKDMIFMDSALTYDGRNSGSTTMTLSGGSTWAYDETLTLTASASQFVSGDVGNEIHLEGADGELIRFEITGYTSATVVTGRPNRTVPASLQSTATTVWADAVDEITGLWHLEGLDVSVLGDGTVVASPYNDDYVTRTITNGTLTLDKCYGVIHIGLPFIADLQTLDIDTAQGETVSDKKKLLNKLTIHLEESAGIYAGQDEPSGLDPLESLYELKLRNDEPYDDPTDLVTGTAEIIIDANWNSNGSIFIRQVDPLPMSVLAVAPAGYVPFR